jgi:hypothetical protein
MPNFAKVQLDDEAKRATDTMAQVIAARQGVPIGADCVISL